MENTTEKDLGIIKESEEKRCKEIFILINLAKMTLTEINTLSDNERNLLCTWFQEQNDRIGKEMSKRG